MASCREAATSVIVFQSPGWGLGWEGRPSQLPYVILLSLLASFNIFLQIPGFLRIDDPQNPGNHGNTAGLLSQDL
ncbi:Uncharacterised protein [Bifidobacterium longum]|uniref:Uncharacterized protein n=1 Tax=Bifidobacterium longum TaxID=216816 RepID=A0A6N2SMF4_BIFLN